MDNKLRDKTAMFFKPLLADNLSADHHRMMVVCKLGEAVEAWRRNQHADIESFKTMLQTAKEQTTMTKAWYATWYPNWYDKYILNSVEDKIGDAAIRALIYYYVICEDVNLGYNYDESQATFVESVDILVQTIYNTFEYSNFFWRLRYLYKRLGYRKASDFDYIVNAKLTYLGFRGLDEHKRF